MCSSLGIHRLFYSFFVRIMKQWNALSKEIAAKNSFNVFKSKLSRFIFKSSIFKTFHRFHLWHSGLCFCIIKFVVVVVVVTEY